ncbi:MAG TPA: DUF5668 domain-containing protein [Anaerolineales bacterium]
MNEGYHHRGLVWPILVITAGVLLLLSNLGVLSLDLWELMLQSWPLILIAIGIDLLIGRRSVWGSIVAAVLIIAVLLLGLGLYSGRIDEQFRISQGKATLQLREIFPTPYVFGRTPDWELQMGAAIPLELSIDSGVGRAVVDLRGLQLDSLNVDLGVGQISVWLPAEGEMSVDIGMGVGQTIIRVRRGLGVRISTDRGLVGLDLPDDFSGADAGYTSPGYSNAADRVEITVSQGVGLISIRYND